MISVLGGNYTKDNYDFLKKVLTSGIYDTANCINKYGDMQCKMCTNKVVCDDIMRVLQFIITKNSSTPITAILTDEVEKVADC